MAKSLPVLTTERLVLRPLRLSDAPAMHPVFARDDVMQYWSSPAHKSLKETKSYMKGNVRQDTWWTWAITQAEDLAIGWVSLSPDKCRTAEIGYILNPDHGGHGYAREAVAGIIQHAFEAMDIRRIKADVDPDNASSIRLLERLGFQKEGYLRAEWETHIGVRDSLIFGLLREEWRGPA